MSLFSLLKLAKKFGKSMTKAKKFKLKVGSLKKLKGMKKAMKKATKKRIKPSKFKKLRQKKYRVKDKKFVKSKHCKKDPVDVVVGEVILEQQDFLIPGRIPIEWNRYYGSHGNRIGVCGRGWETPSDARLEFNVDGTVVFYDGTGAPTYFDRLPIDEPIYEPVDGSKFEKVGEYYTIHIKEDLIYCFMIPKENVGEVLVWSIKDLCGNLISFLRDKNGLKEIRDGSDRSINIISQNGFIQAMYLNYPYSNPQLLVKYEYDENGNLSTVFDALNVPYKFVYKGNLLVQHINKNGLSFYYEYDKYLPEGRCTHTWGDGGLHEGRFVYHDDENMTEVIDSTGVSYLKYNERYLVIEEIDVLGGVTKYDYDDVGRTTAVTDPDGNRTEYLYDQNGNLINLSLPDNNCIITEYDVSNKPIKITDSNGASWKQEWDCKGLLVIEKSPLGAETKYKYNDIGQPVDVSDPLGGITKFEYDAYGNLICLTDVLGNTSKFTYDMLGNTTSRIDALGQKTVYQYDFKGRLIQSILPSGSFITCAYDKEDNLISYKDENGAETRIEYCGLNEVKCRIQPDGGIVEYKYNTEEQLIAVINQRGERYELKRDPLGRIVGEVDYWGQERKYSYSAASHLRESIDPLGIHIKYNTDPMGRIIEKLLPDTFDAGKTQTETFKYDANGMLVTCENKDIKVEWRYDVEGKLIEEKQGELCVITHEYDLNSNHISRTTKIECCGETKTQTVNYSYDSLGRALSVEIPGHDPLSFNRNGIGQITGESLGGNLKRHFEYNRDGYLISQKVLNGEGHLFGQEYTYDYVGNMTGIKDTIFGLDRFKYDNLGRIINHISPESKVKTYLHDKVGNLLNTEVVVNENKLVWSRDGEYDGIFYRFDKDGNLTDRRGMQSETTFVWDANQMLVESVTNGCITVYKYDPLGRRISKDTNGVTTLFYWDGDALLGDIKLENSTILSLREWIYYPETFESLAMLKDLSLYIYFNEPNGLPIRLMELNGRVVWSAKYDALGKVVSLPVNEVDNPIRMQGQYFDYETGLYYNRYRYFEPQIGMFISQDPLGLKAGENIYGFAPNTKTWIDPLGLKCKNWQEYEKKVRSLYGNTPFKARKYSAVVDGKRVNGIADNVTVINGKRVAVEAKFVNGGDWAKSIRNPNSPIGSKPFAVAEQQKVLDQAKKYSNAFDEVVYHSNSPEFISHYTNVFQQNGIQNFRFIHTPD